jgi:hypothetical protein
MLELQDIMLVKGGLFSLISERVPTSRIESLSSQIFREYETIVCKVV